MKVREKVSIIIPTFNQGSFIELCLENLLNQGIEIICVDALSKDNTLDILEKYAEKRKIKLIYAKKRSYGYQMNLGMAEANGEFLAFIYPWQLMNYKAFIRLVARAEKEKLDALYADVKLFRRKMLLEEKIFFPELAGSQNPLPEFLENVMSHPLRSVHTKEEALSYQEIKNKDETSVKKTKKQNGFREDREYMFPFHLFPRGAKIVIYGAEKIGDEFYRQAMESGWVTPIAIIDSSEVLSGLDDMRLVPHEKLTSLCFDYVLLSNLDKTTALQQQKFLLGLGLKKKCIKWQGENYRYEDWQKNFYLPLLMRLKGFLKPHEETDKAHVKVREVFHREKGKKYIFVDLSYISKTDLHTGIQRVVNNTYWQMKKLSHNFVIVPTQYGEGGLLTCFSYEARTTRENKEEMRIELSQGDILFFLDSVWDYWREMEKLMKQAKNAGAKCVALFYDLIPIRHPEFLPIGGSNSNFKAFTALCGSYMDMCLAISKTTADDLYNYFEEMHFRREKPVFIHWIRMGCDIAVGGKGNVKKVRLQLKKFLQGEVFLMVGTVEIRKNCELVIEAFDKALNNDDFKGKLLIIGKDGWGNDAAKAALKKLPSDKVLWLQDASDEELQYAYQYSKALVNASKAEGFGLPLIEAAQAGLPLIVSDISIYHEVAEKNAIYFDNSSSDSLKEILLKWSELENIPDSKKIKLHEWEETAENCLDVFSGKRKYYCIYG